MEIAMRKRWILGTPRWQLRVVGHGGRGAKLPSPKRLKQLFAKHVPGAGELVVVRQGLDHYIVEVSPGLGPKKCRNFLVAVAKETIPKRAIAGYKK